MRITLVPSPSIPSSIPSYDDMIAVLCTICPKFMKQDIFASPVWPALHTHLIYKYMFKKRISKAKKNMDQFQEEKNGYYLKTGFNTSVIPGHEKTTQCRPSSMTILGHTKNYNNKHVGNNSTVRAKDE